MEKCNFITFTLCVTDFYLQRRCTLSSDMSQIQSDPYFRSNCIRSCRLQSIIALCNCVPFFYLDLMPFDNSTIVCALDKLHCLHHFQGTHSDIFIVWINQQVNSINFICLLVFFCVCSQMVDTVIFQWEKCWCRNWIREWFVLLSMSTILLSNTIFNFNDQITITNITDSNTQHDSIVSFSPNHKLTTHNFSMTTNIAITFSV